ncbi:type 1 glutamine amidotransferase [Saccharibacillus alkalitolerans]|uniref:Type 1 glutamine amidotransferase n=1 Tax=Saccharibacillus alkalitolerans TaxID=2705290 RepID=A0ABX0F8F7_9BACL|nr:type 1 glutamine amidotransferase [Saccharibacillus alkalitolerans]NGZ76675.1 type 1 glutamine amidotransferase [Saccharibacillus alkalitolerans]
MKVILLKHFDFDDPAVFTGWAEEEGHRLNILNPTREALDDSLLDGTDLLIVGGSPAGVYQEDEHPWLVPEKAFVRAAVDRGIKVFGICFGAQMLAELLGGRAYAHSLKEIGWHEIRRSEAFHPALVGLPDAFRSLQWHGDTFDLPPGAVRLASSEHCANQAYAWGDNVLAVQFHLETSQSCMRTMLDVWEHDLRRDHVTVQSAEAILSEQERIAESFALLRGILSNFAASGMPAGPLEKI